MPYTHTYTHTSHSWYIPLHMPSWRWHWFPRHTSGWGPQRRLHAVSNKVFRGWAATVYSLWLRLQAYGVSSFCKLMHDGNNIGCFKSAAWCLWQCVWQCVCVCVCVCRYCLNRDPERFALTHFFIDRFHENNHNACSKAHFLSGSADMSFLNSQTAEWVHFLNLIIAHAVLSLVIVHAMLMCLFFLPLLHTGPMQAIQFTACTKVPFSSQDVQPASLHGHHQAGYSW